MRRIWVAVWLLASGCIRDELVDCGGGIACPGGTACAAIADTTYCVAPADIGACTDRDPFAGCTRSDGSPGACYAAMPASVCLPAGCGNGLIDPGEVCDDQNGVVGDGCSANCLSDESCGNGIVDPVRGEQCDDGDRVGHDGCASDCRPEGPQWDQLVFGLPDPVFSQALAYDTARRRLVVFGGAFQVGNNSTVAHDQTWEWDGVAWMKISTPISPSGRFGHVMAYDPVRRRTVMFGGSSSGFPVGTDTWEWDGNAWAFRPTTHAPPARFGASAVYDPERHRVLMFGGDTGMAKLGDQWEWDGTTWTERVGAAPSPRSGHGMTYDPVRGVMVIAGGELATGEIGDTWERSNGTWVARGPTPAELTQPTLAFDGIGELAFGGSGAGGSRGNTWRWTGVTGVWTLVVSDAANGTTPQARELAGLARDPNSGNVILVGGHSVLSSCGACGSTRADVWTWTGSTQQWKNVQPAAPLPRAYHVAAYDSLRGTTVVFGGAPDFGGVITDSQTWELASGHWTLRNVAGPPARSGAEMAFDAGHGECVMFGGHAVYNTSLDETWLWNGTRWLQASPATRPPARDQPAMAYDPVRRRVVLFGGAQATELGDTWEWDGTSWTQVSPAISPPARYRAAMAYDPIRKRVVLFGGETSGATFDDTWEWDGASWTRVVVAQSPSPRGSSAAVWNGARGSLTLFAGSEQVFSQLEDSWELTDGTWAQVFTPTRAGVHQGHSLTPLADGTGVVAFGGIYNNAQPTSELWRLRWNNTDTYELCTLDVDADGDGLAGCADPDCWARCTPMCPPGTACDASWPHCGDGVCNTALEDCRLCPQDCTCAPICGDGFCDPGETCPGDC